MGRSRTKKQQLIDELSRLAFMEPEEGQGIKISEKMKALELLGKCLDLFEPQPEAPDNKIEVSVRVVEEQGKD